MGPLICVDFFQQQILVLHDLRLVQSENSELPIQKNHGRIRTFQLVAIHGYSTARKVIAPNPHIVQGQLYLFCPSCNLLADLRHIATQKLTNSISAYQGHNNVVFFGLTTSATWGSPSNYMFLPILFVFLLLYNEAL